ncbi:hypothetical protein TNCV_831411 [Trichonephila clavipes]|nr:hypothetical protein TNCV_831411 [Trichonephila clavipes]
MLCGSSGLGKVMSQEDPSTTERTLSHSRKSVRRSVVFVSLTPNHCHLVGKDLSCSQRRAVMVKIIIDKSCSEWSGVIGHETNWSQTPPWKNPRILASHPNNVLPSLYQQKRYEVMLKHQKAFLPVQGCQYQKVVKVTDS